MDIKWTNSNAQRQKKILEKQVELGKLSNCYLFYGPGGVGKDFLIEDFIRIIRCQDSNKKPCLECEACRAFNDGRDQDFIKVNPDGNSIKIDQIREIKNKVSLSSYEKKRIIWVKSANYLTTEAANSILKILEDKNRTIFILSTEGIDFPLTIVSRSQLIYISPNNVKINNSGDVNDIINSTGLGGLSNRLKKDKQFRNQFSKSKAIYDQFKSARLSNNISKINNDLVNNDISKLLFDFIVIERYNLLVGGDDKSKHNLSKLVDSYRKYNRLNINKKILLKNLMFELE
jgi:hypothetical protein